MSNSEDGAVVLGIIILIAGAIAIAKVLYPVFVILTIISLIVLIVMLFIQIEYALYPGIAYVLEPQDMEKVPELFTELFNQYLSKE